MRLLSRMAALAGLALLAAASFAVPALADVTIYNFLPNDGSGDNDIVHVFIDNMHHDYLYGGGYIVPGDKVTFPKRAYNGCSLGYEFRAITRAGETFTLPAMEVCNTNYSISEDEGVTWGILDRSSVTPKNAPNDYRINFVNDSNALITGIYATSSQDNRWGDDLLGGRIRPGDSAMINVDDQSGTCVFDIRVVGTRNNQQTTRHFNVCSESEFDVTFADH